MTGFIIGFIIGLLLSLEVCAGIPALVTRVERSQWVAWWMSAPKEIIVAEQLTCALICGTLGSIVQRLI